MIITARLDTLANVKLHKGNNGMNAPCIMDMVDYITGGDGSNDAPACASNAVAQFAIGLNDASVFVEFRQELLPFAVRIAGTAGTPEQEQTRAFILADWAVREIGPLALEANGLIEQAEALRNLAPITGGETAAAAAHAAYAAYAACAADAIAAYAAAARAAYAAARAAGYAATADAAAAARAAARAVYAAGYAATADAAAAARAAYAAARAVYAAGYAADATAACAADATAAARAAYAANTKHTRVVWDMCLEVLDKLIKVTE